MPYKYTFEDIQHRPVAVIGAGTLGRRIAMMFASRGGTARIYARRTEQLASATQYVNEALPKVLKDRGFGEPGVLTATTSLAEALDGAWLAVESAPEKLEIKIPLWGQIDEAAAADTIFATNSSSYPSRLMAENVRDKTRLCNMHFYMPPEVNGVELMSDGQTDRSLLDTLLTVLPEFGVHPFEARRESTGFIFNRIWAAIKREALAVVAEGVALPEDVDGMFKFTEERARLVAELRRCGQARRQDRRGFLHLSAGLNHTWPAPNRSQPSPPCDTKLIATGTWCARRLRAPHRPTSRATSDRAGSAIPWCCCTNLVIRTGQPAATVMPTNGPHRCERPNGRASVLARHLTQAEIAQLAGVSRETVSKSMSDLIRRGRIPVDGPNVLIRNPERLAPRAR